MKIITLQITTRNRLEELKVSLNENEEFINSENVHTIICVDGSSDETLKFIESNYPKIQLIQNKKSIGLIASRNKMMELTKTSFAISLDDDAHFISKNNVESILEFFSDNPNCAVIAFRIYWGMTKLVELKTNLKPELVSGFVGCGHAWRMDHWRRINPYPEWYRFYGEEDYAAINLIKQNLEIWYNPKIFIHHRVDVLDRKKKKEHIWRKIKSLRAGWFNIITFYPNAQMIKSLIYSFYIQIIKIRSIFQFFTFIFVVLNVVFCIQKLLLERSRTKPLTTKQFKYYKSLLSTRVYFFANENK